MTAIFASLNERAERDWWPWETSADSPQSDCVSALSRQSVNRWCIDVLIWQRSYRRPAGRPTGTGGYWHVTQSSFHWYIRSRRWLYNELFSSSIVFVATCTAFTPCQPSFTITRRYRTHQGHNSLKFGWVDYNDLPSPKTEYSIRNTFGKYICISATKSWVNCIFLKWLCIFWITSISVSWNYHDIDYWTIEIL